VVLTNGIILLPPVRESLTEPYSLGLGIVSLLFVAGLWLMRYEVAQSFGEMMREVEESEASWFGLWIQLSHYLGALLLGAMIGALGLTSLITGVRQLVSGVPLKDLPESQWMILPVLLFSFGVGFLMWGVHLRPREVRQRLARQVEEETVPTIGRRLRRPFVELVVAIQANRFFVLLLDTVSGGNDWVLTTAALLFLGVIFYLPLQLLIWRLNNRPVSRWEVWKFFLLLVAVSLLMQFAPDGWWGWIG